MKVFKLFFKMTKSCIQQIIVFLSIMIFFNVVLSRTLTQEDLGLSYTEMKINVVDQDKTPVSQALLKVYQTENQWVDLEDAREVKDDALFGGELDLALLIPQGLEQHFLSGEKAELEYQGQGMDVYKMMAENQANRFFTILDSFRQAAGGKLEGENLDYALKETQRMMGEKTEGSLLPGLDSNKDAIFLMAALPFINYIILAIGFATVGVIVVALENPEVRVRSVVSGFSTASAARQTYLASFVFMMGVWLLNIIVCLFSTSGPAILSEPVVRWALLVSFVDTMASTGGILLLTYLFLEENAVRFMQTIVPLAIAFFSGIFVPASLLPSSVHRLASITPSYWEVEAMDYYKESLTFGAEEMALFRRHIGIMLLMLLAYFVLTLVVRQLRFRRSQ